MNSSLDSTRIAASGTAAKTVRTLSKPFVRTVERLDMPKFMGRWFEVVYSAEATMERCRVYYCKNGTGSGTSARSMLCPIESVDSSGPIFMKNS